MTVRTSITASDVLAAFRKWGVRYATPYADWATHNRNDKGGGWGPINGIFVHNFASNIADTSSEAYLYRGDLTRGMPGPLSQFSLRDDGVVGLIGWGRANHGGNGEQRTYDTARANRMPLNGELTPTSGGNVDMNTHFMAVEMLYGGNKATPAQRASLPRFLAALLDMLGGPAAGYSGGSVVGHRESTNTRSDPEGFSMATIRQQVDALLRSGPPGSKPTTTSPSKVTPTKPTPTPPQENEMQLTDRIKLIDSPDVKYSTKDTTVAGVLASTNFYVIDSRNRLTAQVTALTAAVTALSKSAGLDPAKIEAVIDAAVKDALNGFTVSPTA